MAAGRRPARTRRPRTSGSHRTAEEQFRYENHVRYMIPLDPQVGFLRAAGFEGVDVFWEGTGTSSSTAAARPLTGG